MSDTRAPCVSGPHCLEEIKSSHFTDEEPKGEELTSDHGACYLGVELGFEPGQLDFRSCTQGL